MVKLFSYGTLQQANVQQDLFGRTLTGTLESLAGYQVGEVKITDAKVIAMSGKDRHPVLLHTGNNEDCVSGTLFEITEDELAKADEYEVDDYQREEVTFVSGAKGYAYLQSR